MTSIVTVDDLIAATLNLTLTWSRDADPVADWYGNPVFIGRHGVYLRDRRDWTRIGPSDDLRRAIEHVREGQ